MANTQYARRRQRLAELALALFLSMLLSITLAHGTAFASGSGVYTPGSGGWCNCEYHDGGYHHLQYNEGDGYITGFDSIGDSLEEYRVACIGEYQHYQGAPYYSGELCSPNLAHDSDYHFYNSPGVLLTPRVLKAAGQCSGINGCNYYIWGWESWYS